MLAYLKGKIITKGDRYLLVEHNGLGYKVYVTITLWADLDIGQEVEFFTHHHIREDASDLYGFKTQEELDFFEKLISITGVGPKSALGVMTVAEVKEIKAAIANNDPTILTKVSGIGRKTAERVVLELKEKVEFLASKDEKESVETNAEVIDALVGLGYKINEARDLVRKMPIDLEGTSGKIKWALKNLNK